MYISFYICKNHLTDPMRTPKVIGHLNNSTPLIVQMCIYTCTYKSMYIYIYKHMHIYTWICKGFSFYLFLHDTHCSSWKIHSR